MSPRHVGPALLLSAALAFVTAGCPVRAAAAATAPGTAAATPPPAAPEPATTAAPASAPAPAQLRAIVEAVDDSRSTRENAGCRLTLSLFGDLPPGVAAVTNTRVDKAEDNLGRSLLLNADRPGAEMFTPPPFIRTNYALLPPLRTIVLLRNPSRSATVIKTLELTVDLYSPTTANGAIVPITTPLPPAGTAIANDELEKNGIKLVQLTREQEEREVRSVMGVVPNPTPEAERRRLEAVAAEVARRRELREAAAAAADKAGGPVVPVRREAPEQAPVVAPMPARSSDTTFSVIDPNHRLVALQWSDASGSTIRTFVSLVYENRAPAGAPGAPLRLLRSHEQPRPGWHLVAYLATEGSVERRELHLENVPLP